jgi:hypothetical protein
MLEQDRVLLFPVGKAFLSFRCEPFRSRWKTYLFVDGFPLRPSLPFPQWQNPMI